MSGDTDHNITAQELDQRLAELRANLEAGFEIERQQFESRLTEARLDAEATLVAVQAEMREDRLETFTRLIRAVRRLDAATSLSMILEALAKGAVSEAQRVAILLVEGKALRSWGHFGFATGQGPFDMTADQSHLVSAVVTRQQPAVVTTAAADTDPGLPSFMRPPAGQAALVAPLVVGSEVVAVLYAEGAESRSSREEAAVWAEEVELLARHAAARLENVTSERTVAVLTRSS